MECFNCDLPKKDFNRPARLRLLGRSRKNRFLNRSASMSRKDRDDSIWLSEHSDRRRIRDAENARQNRAEITKALSHGQIRRRDLVKWGLFTSAGLMLPIGGLNPFIRSAQGQASSPSAVLAGNSDNQGIPTGLPASPTFGIKPFTQPMPRFDVQIGR